MILSLLSADALNSLSYVLIKLFPTETGTSGAWEIKALETVSYNHFGKASAFHKTCQSKTCFQNALATL